MEAVSAFRVLPEQLRARAFERECERLRPLGEAYVLRRFGGSLGRADAEDAVADVLIRLHRRMADGRPPENLRAAFFTSVRNAAIDQLRSRSLRPTVTFEQVGEASTIEPTPVERAESREDAMRLREAMGRMRPNYREAIVLRYGVGLTVPEIAAHLGTSLPAAKKLVLRATQQVRMRLQSIEAAEFCPEMRDLARLSLFDREASGLASGAEEQVLQAHFRHCGSCRSFLSALHDGLHELGGSALFAGVAGARLGSREWPLLDHLGRWFAGAEHATQNGATKLRLALFKASGAMQPGDAGSAGVLAGSGQKIAAICTAGALTTATCLATGIVGPGLEGSSPPPSVTHHTAAAQVSAPIESALKPPLPEAQPVASSPATEPTPAAQPSPASSQPSEPSTPSQSSASSSPAPAPTPAQQTQAQFGIENSPPPEPAPEPAPAPAPAAPAPSSSSASSSSSSGSGSDGHSSGTESFGFGG